MQRHHSVFFQYMRKMSLVNETLRPETETRPRRWENASRDRLETEMSRPRLHPWREETRVMGLSCSEDPMIVA